MKKELLPFGRVVTLAREAKNLSVRQLAIRAEITSGQMKWIEEGKRVIGLGVLMRLGVALETEPWRLLRKAERLAAKPKSSSEPVVLRLEV